MGNFVQGRGKSTPYKEDGLATLFRMVLRMTTSPALRDYPYWHIELNAGSGWNDEVQCEGSPLVFLRQAMRVGRPVHAYFCDHNADAIRSLRAAALGMLPPDSHATYHVGDNAAFLGLVAQAIRETERSPKDAKGTCLCDPNAWKGLPLDALASFAASFPCVDLILNLNLSWFAMAGKAVKVRRPGFENAEDWPTPAQIVPRLGRKRWFVRKPTLAPGNRFSLLFGTNGLLANRPFKDFVPLDSCAGQDVLHNFRSIDPAQRELF